MSVAWELIGNDHELSIWEHPKIVAILNALIDDDTRVSLISTLLKAKVQDPPTLPSALDLGDPLLNPYLSDIKQFYTRLILNQDTFWFSQYVLSKTEIGSAQNDQSTETVFKVDHRKVLEVFNYNQLLLEEPSLTLQSIVTTKDIWNNLFNNLPMGGKFTYVAGVNLVKLSDLGPAGKNLLWQKRTPKVRMLQKGMWQITQEYWGAQQFDKWKYHRVGTPDWVLAPDITP